jgi:hydrogenase/urease accessory protein HupE
MKQRLLGWLITVFLLTISAFANAHGRSTSYITWTLHESIATVRVKMALIDQNALSASWSTSQLPLDAKSVLPNTVLLFDEVQACSLIAGSFHELLGEHGSVAYEWQTRCRPKSLATPIITSLRSDLLFDVLAAHVALVRFHDVNADLEFDYVLTDSRRAALLPSPAATNASTSLTMIGRFGRAGIEHLLTGWDHLAFLLALVLASRSIKIALICLTGFTLGHSLTLSMAVLGHAAAKTTTVEVLIAISILLVSTENVWLAEKRSNLRLPIACLVGLSLLVGMSSWLGNVSPMALAGMAVFEACYLALLSRSDNPDRLRWLCAGLFGLLHGFGFAGTLSQLDLPAGNRVLPLASFNIGLEIAQVLVACLTWPLLLWLRKRYSEKQVIVWGSALTMALGSYACVTRIFA